MEVNFRRIWYYLWPQIRKQRLAFCLVFLGYLIGVVFNDIVQPLLFRRIIDLLSSGAAKDLVYSQAIHVLVVIFITTIIYNIGFRMGDYANAYFQSKTMKEMYDFTFSRILRHSYHFFSNNFSGSIVAKAKRFRKSFETFFDIVSFQIWFSLISLVGVVVVLFINAPTIAWVFLGWAIVYLLVTIFFIKKKIAYDSIEAEADSIVTGKLSDAVMNILNIKIFSADKSEEESFKLVTNDEELKRRRAWYLDNLQNIAKAIMMFSLQLTILFLSLRFWYLGKISVGTFIMIETYMISLFGILWTLGRSLARAVKSLTEMQEVVDIFDTPIDIKDSDKSEEMKIHKGHILFNNISFSYPGGVDVLENFNLEIKPGEKVGLVGHSGAGKSTITKLLLRFTEISKGSIAIDGQNIQDITQNDLRSAIAYVPQDSILFHRNIKENISYSKPNTTEEEIIEVAKKAHAHEFISKLPKGYDTLVGERGVKLSGGERQRVAIARAMLKDSPILILDEATSSLDSISESYIQDAFEKLMKGKTTIVIAHRLSTIQKLDRIIVLDAGKIVEDGTHQELLARGGVYADLWNHQTGGFLEE
ncbi:MAG: ABC transporter ATP-binding protein [Candidatus Pacebacteria bacterium]|jgi:ATP-binding cassette subfamily B protein|nr:ABC transporter ATP-binding protein [Candidatus Paceibacterota bacterium]